MNLRPRTHHAHMPDPPPDEQTALNIVRQHNELTVYVSRIEHGHPTETVTTKKFHGFKLRWCFEDETQYRYELSTRLHYTLHFDQSDEGKRIILSAAWINPRLQEGPWSEDITEVIG